MYQLQELYRHWQGWNSSDNVYFECWKQMVLGRSGYFVAVCSPCSKVILEMPFDTWIAALWCGKHTALTLTLPAPAALRKPPALPFMSSLRQQRGFPHRLLRSCLGLSSRGQKPQCFPAAAQPRSARGIAQPQHSPGPGRPSPRVWGLTPGVMQLCRPPPAQAPSLAACRCSAAGSSLRRSGCEQQWCAPCWLQQCCSSGDLVRSCRLGSSHGLPSVSGLGPGSSLPCSYHCSQEETTKTDRPAQDLDVGEGTSAGPS